MRALSQIILWEISFFSGVVVLCSVVSVGFSGGAGGGGGVVFVCFLFLFGLGFWGFFKALYSKENLQTYSKTQKPLSVLIWFRYWLTTLQLFQNKMYMVNWSSVYAINLQFKEDSHEAAVIHTGLSCPDMDKLCCASVVQENLEMFRQHLWWECTFWTCFEWGPLRLDSSK